MMGGSNYELQNGDYIKMDLLSEFQEVVLSQDQNNITDAYSELRDAFYSKLLNIAGLTANFKLIKRVIIDWLGEDYLQEENLSEIDFTPLLNAKPVDSPNATSAFVDALANFNMTDLDNTAIDIANAVFSLVGSKGYINILQQLQSINFPIQYDQIIENMNDNSSSSRILLLQYLIRTVPNKVTTYYNTSELLDRRTTLEDLKLLLDNNIVEQEALYYYIVNLLNQNRFEYFELAIRYLSYELVNKLVIEYPSLGMAQYSQDIGIKYIIKNVKGQETTKRMAIASFLERSEITVDIKSIVELILRVLDPFYPPSDPLLTKYLNNYSIIELVDLYKKYQNIDKVIEELRNTVMEEIAEELPRMEEYQKAINTFSPPLLNFENDEIKLKAEFFKPETFSKLLIKDPITINNIINKLRGFGVNVSKVVGQEDAKVYIGLTGSYQFSLANNKENFKLVPRSILYVKQPISLDLQQLEPNSSLLVLG
jgi:hypothetical protein